MTIRYNRERLVQEELKEIKKNEIKNKEFFKWVTLSSINEISQRVYAIERMLVKKKILHPKEINSELKKVQKSLVKQVKKELKLKV